MSVPENRQLTDVIGNLVSMLTIRLHYLMSLAKPILKDAFS